MGDNSKIEPTVTEKLCRCLAFHVVETELTLQHMEGDIGDIASECRKARDAIAEAGFDIDALYPVLDRPTSGEPQ